MSWQALMVCYLRLDFHGSTPLKSHIHMLGDHTSRIEPDFGDSSWPLFTMYSKIAEEEDNKKV
jgi:hypothetical protein